MNSMSSIKPQAADRYHRKMFKEETQPGMAPRPMSRQEAIILRTSITESAWMAGEITLMNVSTQGGQAINLGNSALHTGRAASGRFHRRMAVNGTAFWLSETDSEASLSYDEMSVIASSGNQDYFDETVAAFFAQAWTLDMLRVGFNGTEIADATDPEAHPKGEDVNIGWHAIAKEHDGGKQVITEPLTLGESGTWKNLDALANHLITKRIAEPFREDPRLVVLVGAELAAQQRLKLFNAADRPADVNAAQMAVSSVAGRFAFVPPFMPGKRLAVTTLQNLHIYTHELSHFVKAGFNDDRKEYATSYLRNEGYALGNSELYAAVDEGAMTLTD